MGTRATFPSSVREGCTLEVTEVGAVWQLRSPLGALGLPSLTRERARREGILRHWAATERGPEWGREGTERSWAAGGRSGQGGQVSFPPGGWPTRLKWRLPWRELLPVPTRGHQSAADRRRGGRGQGAEVGVEVTEGTPATE